MSKESMEKLPRKKELSDKTAHTSSVNPFTGVGSPEKRMCKETKATPLDTSVQEILAQHNESCKGKESSTSFKKETCEETGDWLTNGAEQKSNVVSEKETASKNTNRDSSVGAPGNDSCSLKSQLASAPLDEFEEPVSEGKKREKRKKVTTPEVLEAGSKAYVSDKKECQTKNPRKGKSKEKEGRCTSLSDDVPKRDGITGEDSTKEKASVPLDEFVEPVSEARKREKRKKVTTPELPEAGSKTYASDKKKISN